MLEHSDINFIALHQKLGQSKTVKACTDTLLASLQPFGIDTLACGDLDLEIPERHVFFAIAWPKSWRDFYVQSGLIERDPLREGLKKWPGPFTWSELAEHRKLSRAGTETLRLVAKNGWTEGLAVPIPHSERHIGLVSLVAREGPFSPATKMLLVVLSTAYYLRVRRLAASQGLAAPPMGLTPREIDCIRLVARGLSDREIASELSISVSTVQEHVENCKRKLQAANRSEAVAIAISFAIATR